jgi:hypothetical protein
MTNCKGCGVELTPENDSDAHLIPKALGGRLAPRGILCRKCNTELNDAADHALIEAFGAWPTLLDIPREGSNQPKTVDTREGRRVRVQADGKLTRTDVVYHVKEMPEIEGHLVSLGAGDMKTARHLLARAKKEFPQLDLDEAIKRLKVQGIQDDDELRLSLDFSPPAVFGGVLTAIWLFILHRTRQAFVDKGRLIEWIKNLQEVRADTFRYFVNGLPGLEGPDIKLGHKIVVRTVSGTGELVAYVEILGILRIGGVIAKLEKGQAMGHIYAYDLLEKKDRSAEFSINSDKFNAQRWDKVGLTPNEAPALKAYFLEALKILAELYYSRPATDELPD